MIMDLLRSLFGIAPKAKVEEKVEKTEKTNRIAEISEKVVETKEDVTSVDTMIDHILEKEGGYVNHKNDKGGATNFGITYKTLSKWRKSVVTEDDVKNLKVEEAREIYKHNYYYAPKIDRLPEEHQLQIFDMGVNMGPRTCH